VSTDALSRSESRRTRIGALLLAAAVALAFGSSFSGAFQFDDIPALLENPTLRHLWPPWLPLLPPRGALTVSGRPLLNLSFALNYALSGYRPWSYHAFNLLIHLGAALALFGIVRRTLAARWSAERVQAFFPAFAAALLWAVHPLQTESVTYIVQRAECLAGLCYLLTLYGFIRAARIGDRPEWAEEGSAGPREWSWGWGAFSLLACLAGVGVKEVMVTAPVTVFLYDRTFVAGGWASAWRRRRAYYLGLAATWIPLLGLVASTGWDRGSTAGFHVGVSWIHYWVTQGEAVARYLALSFWPHPLAFDYGPSGISAALAWALFAGLLAALAVTAVGCLRGRPWAFPAGAAFLVLSPTSVVPGVLQFVAEHRMYLPLAAITTGAVLAVRAVGGHLTSRSARRAAAVTLLILAAGGLSLATARRNLTYRSDLELWRDTIAKRPGSALAQANVGGALLTRDRTAEALPYCLEAVRLDPMKPTAHYNLGLAYEGQKRFKEALREFEIAAWINPKLFYAQFRAGRVLDRLGRPAEAEHYLRLALATQPDYGAAHGSLGVALSALGHSAEAIAEFEASLRLQPDQPEVEFDLGIALARAGRQEEAAAHYAAAVRLQPDYAEAQLNLGVTLAELGRFAAALPPLHAAVRLQPDSADAHGNLAAALEEVGQGTEAVAEYRRALALRPAFPAAHYNLGNALLRGRDLPGARAEFAEALRLDPNFQPAREMLDRLAHFPGF
jgi:tetratricopeptide (TPR) repeat protein